MKKRGEFTPTKVLAVIILTLIAGLAIWQTTKAAGTDTSIYVDDRICAGSIAVATKEKIPDFNCEAQRLTIIKEDFDKGDNVTRELANKMIEFWYTVGAGENQPYPLKSTFNEVCLIGYIIEFKDINNIKGMDLFMTQNEVRGKKYHEHLYSRAATDEEIQEFEKQEDIIDTSVSQAIVWRVNRIGSHDYQSMEIIPYQQLDKKCSIVMN
ncbi:MAG: hypothetical protein MAG795_01002 [Candidatus Woesearchaeota archaeon]|nr:hypothetical protein [Candidatus Woesearchaeota archaeon]